MAIRRQKRIDLSSYDPEWSTHNCYILLYTLSYLKIQDYRKETKQTSQEMDSLAARKTKFEVDSQEYKDLEAKEDELSDALINKMINLVRANLAGGLIYDADDKATRAIVADDIDSFDTEIIKDVAQAMMGVVEKKV